MPIFSNKVAVITGAASGIGKALAIQCLHEKMKVVLCDKDKSSLSACVKELTPLSLDIISIEMDVSKEEDLIAVAKTTLQHFGGVHFLFNNAGIPGPLGPIWQQSSVDIEKVLQVNLMGTIYGIKTFVPIMLAQPEACYIINTSAGAGLLTGEDLSAYKASKHAITAISEVLFNDLKKQNANIHVSLLIPHWVSTNIAQHIQTPNQQIIQERSEHLKNFGISPTLVAEKVFAGLKDKKFYIFTHYEEHAPKIKTRLEKILSLANPN